MWFVRNDRLGDTAAMLKRCLALLLAILASGLVHAQSFVPVYAANVSAQHQALDAQLRRSGFLERLAWASSQLFDTPRPIALSVGECGTANAFYRSLPDGRGQVVLCYELLTQLEIERREAVRRGARLPNNIVGGAVAFILMHEIGHALVHQLNIPTLGGEEDAADAIAAYVLLNMPNGNDNWLQGALWFFNKAERVYSRAHYSAVHSLHPQRQATIACLAFGKDAQRFLAYARGLVSAERGRGCAREYQRVAATLQQQFGARFRPDGLIAGARPAPPAGSAPGGGFAPSSRTQGQSCNSNSDCSGSLRCEAGSCAGDEDARPALVFPASSRLLGQSCNSNSDCSGSLRCESAVCRAD